VGPILGPVSHGEDGIGGQCRARKLLILLRGCHASSCSLAPWSLRFLPASDALEYASVSPAECKAHAELQATYKTALEGARKLLRDGGLGRS
jgi:hypothetical protein